MITSFILGALVMYTLCWFQMRKMRKALIASMGQRNKLCEAAREAGELLRKMTDVLHNSNEAQKATLAKERLKISVVGLTTIN